MYEAVVTVHILSGMAWVGAGIVYLWGSHTIGAQKGEEEALHTRDRLEKATAAISVAPFLVIGTGIAQVFMSEQHEWSHLWIILGLALAVAALSLGAANDAGTKKAQRAQWERGQLASRTLGRSIRLLWIELAVMAAIVALMVTKPL